MKQSRFITPVLLYLTIILFIIVAYINFVYRPLETKIDAVSMENELLKNRRMELELAMIDKDNIIKEIEISKALLEEDTDFVLIDGGKMADDIYQNAGKSGIQIQSINVGRAKTEMDLRDGAKSLFSTQAEVSFIADYDKAVYFIKRLEESKTGAYKATLLNVTEENDDLYNWQLSLSLYFYGDPDSAGTNEDTAETEKSGEKMWTQ